MPKVGRGIFGREVVGAGDGVVGGSGMVDPRVFAHVGYDAEKYTGFAFGFGIERMAMLRHGVNDVKLYFDKMSGLLVRQTRYAPTAVGTVPLHVTYSNYRDVPGVGVKMPFTFQMTWVDGQYTVNLESVQPNVPIDAARFAKPASAR